MPTPKVTEKCEPPPPPPPPPDPAVPALEMYPDRGRGVQIVTLIGGGVGATAQYVVGLPLPIDLIVGGAVYNLSDRPAGIYTFRA